MGNGSSGSNPNELGNGWTGGTYGYENGDTSYGTGSGYWTDPSTEGQGEGWTGGTVEGGNSGVAAPGSYGQVVDENGNPVGSGDGGGGMPAGAQGSNYFDPTNPNYFQNPNIYSNGGW